jgi:transcriptional regulator with XRE-family HTH domain
MDLKSFREDKLKLSQSQFAELIQVEQSQISRWESNPDTIRFDVIQKILEKTGATYEELTGWRKPIPKPLNVEDSWKKADFTKRNLSDYIVNALEGVDIPYDQRKAYVDDLRKGISTSIIKPKVTIVGRSDTGKSTLINALLGAEKMPTAWTPTTSIAVYIKHISDKPSFIEEDVDVWVFKNHLNGEDLWDERRLQNEEYCRSWKIGAGGVEILRTFGTRQGENYLKNAGAAVLFLEAPILNTCDIVDLPGFGTDTEADDNITFKATQSADVIVYLSQANGFMRIEDITYLKRNISELPIWEKKGENDLAPLANLFIVASQAHTINNGNREQLKGILDVGCSNLLKTLSDGYWTNRQKMSGYKNTELGKEELRKRFFSYTTDIPDICERFNSELRTVLEALPLIIDKKAKEFVTEFVKTRKPNLLNELQKYEELENERDKYILLLKEIDKNELARTQDNDKRKNDIRDEIDRLRDESIREFSDYCSSVINTDSLIALIKNKDVKSKKESVEQFGSLLQSMIQENCESILVSKSEILAQKTKDYIAAYSESVSRAFNKSSVKMDFDAKWNFMSALSKISAIGGIGGFAFGAGAFIFANWTILTAIFGGVRFFATPFLFVPGIGQIALILGLLLTVVAGALKLFGVSWEKNLAKKIVKFFDEEDVIGQFRAGIRDFWVETNEAFNQAATALDNDWASYVKNLRNVIDEYDINEIRHKIASLKVLSDFFDNIPL